MHVGEGHQHALAQACTPGHVDAPVSPRFGPVERREHLWGRAGRRGEHMCMPTWPVESTCMHTSIATRSWSSGSISSTKSVARVRQRGCGSRSFHIEPMIAGCAISAPWSCASCKK